MSKVGHWSVTANNVHMVLFRNSLFSILCFLFWFGLVFIMFLYDHTRLFSVVMETVLILTIRFLSIPLWSSLVIYTFLSRCRLKKNKPHKCITFFSLLAFRGMFSNIFEVSVSAETAKSEWKQDNCGTQESIII